MARRLSVPRMPAGESRILEGVPHPGSLTAGRCAVLRALMAALEPHGRGLGYDTLMGVTGLAFMLPVDADFRQPAGDAARCEGIQETLAALGIRAQWRLAAGAPEDLEQVVEEILDRGWAVPVLGWPDPQDGWGVVTGYDRGRGVWCGWPCGHRGEAYLGAPPAAEAFLVLEDAGAGPPPPMQVAQGALRRAAQLLARTGEGYQVWLEMLAAEWDTAADAPEHIARVLRHEALVEAVADARSAAAAFLRSCGPILAPPGDEWADAAAEHCDGVVACIEARRPAPMAPKAARALASERWREEWAESVQRMAHLDNEVGDCIMRALESDLGPADLEDTAGW